MILQLFLTKTNRKFTCQLRVSAAQARATGGTKIWMRTLDCVDRGFAHRTKRQIVGLFVSRSSNLVPEGMLPRRNSQVTQVQVGGKCRRWPIQVVNN